MEKEKEKARQLFDKLRLEQIRINLPPTKACIIRIGHDLKHLYQAPVEGIFVAPDEDKVNVCHAILLGPADTPYEWGFFYFLLEFPYDYPHNPPKVTLQTTGGGGVRFNPNFYQDGKVCLSILGTWPGPSWSPVHTIESILLSIRSLMNEHPYHNEPGYEDCKKKVGASRNYNHYVRHETLRVAVLDMAEHSEQLRLPSALCDTVREIFLDCIEIYRYMCEEYMFLDGRHFDDPFSSSKGSYSFSQLKDRIDGVKRALMKEVLEDDEGSVARDDLEITAHGSVDATLHDRPATTLGAQPRLFCAREVLNNFRRDTTALATKFGPTIFLAVLIGVIFLNEGPHQCC